MTGRRRAAGPAATTRWRGVLAWSGFLAGCLAALHAVGGPLAPPPLSDPAALGPWLDARAPAEAAIALARLVAIALAWYLLAATAAGVLARLSGAEALVRLADAVSVPLVRRLVHGAVSLSIVAAASGASAATAYATPPAAVPDGSVSGRASTAPPPTMRLLPSTAEPPVAAPPPPPPVAPEGSPLPAERPSAGPATTVPRAGDDPVGTATSRPTGGEWTVRPGDHLWAVAERTLADAWGRPPGDAEVDPYWRAVVEANRARLRDPADPDLVFPGQVLALPPTPAPPPPG